MLGEVVTSTMVGGVLDEIIALLPVLVPAGISFIAVRKGIEFLFSTLRGA